MLELSPAVNTILIIEFIILFLFAVSFSVCFQIFFKWDFLSKTHFQYELEKKSYLVSTILKNVFIIKIILLFYFIFAMDKLAIKIPGAMCAVGVLNSSIYGKYLLLIKIIVIFLSVLWLFINYYDFNNPNLPYTKFKSGLFLIIFIFFAAEIILEIKFFYLINPDKIVTCCGAVFNKSQENISITDFIMKPGITVIIFYISYFFLLISFFFSKGWVYGVFSFFFLITSIISLIYFFSSYIYELPSHKCPFCLLQSDYFFIGYLLYILLFAGSFTGMSYGFVSILEKNLNRAIKKTSFALNTFYLITVTIYPILYFARNKVWL